MFDVVVQAIDEMSHSVVYKYDPNFSRVRECTLLTRLSVCSKCVLFRLLFERFMCA